MVRPADSEDLRTHNKAHLETEVAWGKTMIQRARLKMHQLQQSEKVLYVFSCFCFYLFLGLKKERERQQIVAIRKVRPLKVRKKIKAKT